MTVKKLGLAIGAAWILLVPIRLMVPLALQTAQKVHHSTAMTTGRVIAFDPSNHCEGTIEYWVKGVRYTAGKSGMYSSDLGKPISVHYDPQNATICYVGVRPPFLIHNLVGVGIIAILCSGAILLGAYGERRKHK